MINNCTFIGNVGKDPEAKYFESGSCVAEFTLAINKPPKDGQEQEPSWINCKAWGKTAQVAADYVRKGHRIAVVAHLDQESWTDRTTGEKRSKLVFIVDRLQLLTSKAEAEGRSQGQGQPEPRQRRQTAAAAAPAWNSQLDGDPSDDEVPF
jgi:single-strand DNA-binding protein